MELARDLLGFFKTLDAYSSVLRVIWSEKGGRRAILSILST